MDQEQLRRVNGFLFKLRKLNLATWESHGMVQLCESFAKHNGCTYDHQAEQFMTIPEKENMMTEINAEEENKKIWAECLPKILHSAALLPEFFAYKVNDMSEQYTLTIKK